MKKIIAPICFMMVFVISDLSWAKPFSSTQKKAVVAQPALKEKMQLLLKRLEAMDAVANRLEKIDYKSFSADAVEILSVIKEIRALDKTGVFKKDLSVLENAATQLHVKSEKKNPEALIETNRIANACFQCHQIHRGKDL